jgi:hypothetical protein
MRGGLCLFTQIPYHSTETKRLNLNMSLVDDITEMATEQEIIDYLNEEFLDEVPEEPTDLPELL